MQQSAYLVLENGKIFKGKAFGSTGDAVGETVFTTSMVGCHKTLTSKNHYKQIVVHSFPLIGNYGIIPPDFESSSPCMSAYIVKHWCREPSNFRSEGTLDAFLFAHNIVGLYGIDTRSLTQTLRSQGIMNSMVTQDPSSVNFAALRAHSVQNAIYSVSTPTAYHATPESKGHKVCVLDFGLQNSLLAQLAQWGCDVHVLPAKSTPEEVLAHAPRGIVLSGGPGGPSENPEILETLKILAKSGIPMFGVDLGHLLLASSVGVPCTKMKCGHYGANQPIKDLRTGRIYISSQSHSYVAVPALDSPTVSPWLLNVNGQSCEGLLYNGFPAFSAQFHPDADTGFVFSQFIQMMEETTNATK